MATIATPPERSMGLQLSVMGIFSVVRPNREDSMDELCIFAKGNVDWSLFRNAVSTSLELDGTDCSDEDQLRHQWKIDGFEVLSIANPRYEDDCGIPFSTYSHQVLVLDANMTSDLVRTDNYNQLVRYLARRMSEIMPNELVIIKNLQSIV